MATSWLFLLLLLQFTETTMGQPDYTTVRIGADVTLPCKNLMKDQNTCDRTSWLFTIRSNPSAITLAQRGQIPRSAGRKSDRLSVTQDCSLVIKEVKEEDAGRYDCRQIRQGQQFQDSTVFLSVVKISPSAPVTEDDSAEDVTLRCSVSIYDRCTHTVRWLFQGGAVERDIRQPRTSCSDSFSFSRNNLNYTKRVNSFACEVTSEFAKKPQLFPFSPQILGEAPGEDATTTQLMTGGEAAGTEYAPKNTNMWVYVAVAAVLVALLLIAVAFVIWKKTKGKKTQMNEELVDMDDGISYASISHAKHANGNAKIRRKADDGGEEVMYSTVKASTADPGNLYATVK